MEGPRKGMMRRIDGQADGEPQRPRFLLRSKGSLSCGRIRRVRGPVFLARSKIFPKFVYRRCIFFGRRGAVSAKQRMGCETRRVRIVASSLTPQHNRRHR